MKFIRLTNGILWSNVNMRETGFKMGLRIYTHIAFGFYVSTTINKKPR